MLTEASRKKIKFNLICTSHTQKRNCYLLVSNKRAVQEFKNGFYPKKVHY